MLKKIEGYEDYYISDDGRVYSAISHKWLKPTVDKDGYKIVNLYKDKKRKSFRIHKLVAYAFIPIPYGAVEVDHIDRNNQNNNVDNLRWVSHKENMLNRGKLNTTRWGDYYVYKDGELLGVYDTLYKVRDIYGCSRMNLRRHMINGTPTASGLMIIPEIWLENK